MSPVKNVPYVEIRVPDSTTEQEFLLLAVQAAVTTYRASHRKDSSPADTTGNGPIVLRPLVG